MNGGLSSGAPFLTTIFDMILPSAFFSLHSDVPYDFKKLGRAALIVRVRTAAACSRLWSVFFL